MILGARMLAEFGDASGRYTSVKTSENYAGASPIIRASGKKIVAARFVHNDRLIDTLSTQAFCALGAVASEWHRIGTSIAAFGPYLDNPHIDCERTVTDSLPESVLHLERQYGEGLGHDQAIDYALDRCQRAPVPADRETLVSTSSRSCHDQQSSVMKAQDCVVGATAQPPTPPSPVPPAATTPAQPASPGPTESTPPLPASPVPGNPAPATPAGPTRASGLRRARGRRRATRLRGEQYLRPRGEGDRRVLPASCRLRAQPATQSWQVMLALYGLVVMAAMYRQEHPKCADRRPLQHRQRIAQWAVGRGDTLGAPRDVQRARGDQREDSPLGRGRVNSMHGST